MRPRFLLALAFVLNGCATAVTPGHPYHLQPHQIDEIKGTYVLDNGTTVKISNMHRRLYVEFGQRGKAEMLAVSENHFEVPAQHMTMEYRPDGFGDVIVLTYPADANAASGEMVRATLALR